MLKDNRVQTLIFAINVQKLGIATLSYGGMIYLASTGASQLQVSLVGVTGFIAELLFGLQGGRLTDAMSKRTAMIIGYLAQAALCFIVPIFFGTDVVDLVFLAFMASILATVMAPAIKSTVALVSTPAALATVAAMIGLFGSFGTAIGQAFVAPILIKTSGIDAVMYGAGILLASGVIWALRMPRDQGQAATLDAIKQIEWKSEALDLRKVGRWIMSVPGVSTIILTGAIVSALGESFSSMIPVYVREVLDADPTYSVYIFAPAGIGFLIGMLTAPWLIEKYGARKVGFASFVITAVGIMLYGFIDVVAPVLGPISPTRLFELFGVDLSNAMLAAGFLALPANFGSTSVSTCVQTYINRRVPVQNQGGVFGMQRVVYNAVTIVAMLVLGLIATLLGSQIVFILAPIVVVSIVAWLLRYSYRLVGKGAPGSHALLDDFWNGPGKRSDDSKG